MNKILKDPVLIIGFVISWGTAVSLLFAGQDSILSTLIGLVGSVLVMLLDVLLNLQQNKNEVLKAFDSRWGPQRVTLLPRVADVFETAAEMIESAPSGSNIYLTAIAPNPTIDSPGKASYRKRRDKLTSRDDCNFYRIITVADRPSFEQLLENLAASEKSAHYELRVLPMPGPGSMPNHPSFDVLIINSSEAQMRFPHTFSLKERGALYFRDPEIVEMLLEYFRGIWESAQVLNSPAGVNESLLRQLEERFSELTAHSGIKVI